jgi:hydrogenase expression/formation protein HypC
VCLGVPLQIQAIDGAGAALCPDPDASAAAGGQRLRRVDVSLLDSPPGVGDWILVHVGLAIRTMDALEARQVRDALRAVTAAAEGRAFEHLLGDLLDREPELPPHLRAQQTATARTEDP